MPWQNILEIFKNITLIDILDVLIVTYIIYRAILLFQQTRAMALVKGIFVLLLITILSDFLQTRTLSWLLNSMWTVGLIAFIILFQPELRKALEHFGKGGILVAPNFLNRQETQTEEAISEVVKAVSILSKNQIGALIVFERTSGIRDYMETGIAIDSLVSSSLLINIFIPNTPLHDGAVMIRKGRIIAAACYLPLTTNDNISSELGSRHRAAIGVSENSDAVALVVSEETGTISLAINGVLHRHLDTELLKERLIGYLGEESQERILDKWMRGVTDE